MDIWVNTTFHQKRLGFPLDPRCDFLLCPYGIPFLHGASCCNSISIWFSRMLWIYYLSFSWGRENAIGALIPWDFSQKFLCLFQFLYQNQKKSTSNIFQKNFNFQFWDPVRENLYALGGINFFPIIFMAFFIFFHMPIHMEDFYLIIIITIFICTNYLKRH